MDEQNCLTEADREALVSRIKWRLDHFGPLRDDGTPYSRFESPAHAAADAVCDWLAARVAAADSLRQAVEALCDDNEGNRSPAYAGATNYVLIADLREVLTRDDAAITAALDTGPRVVGPTCSDNECPIYARHRAEGQSFSPHGPHDFRAALDTGLRERLAQAWDEGFNSDYEGDGWPPNPYREVRATRGGEL